jgi:PAS domain S-box-containing protein
MSLLQDIAADAGQVAEAISISMGVEVEIVDDELTIVGGTAVYGDMIGRKEEAGRVNGNYLYANVLRSGKTEFVADALRHEGYGSSVAATAHGVGELAEICTPIKMGRRTIGIIGLVALTEAQRTILIDKDRNLVPFVEKMADLLAAKAEVQAMLNDSESSRNEMAAILESTHEGIFAVDRNGYIKHCNHISERLFNVGRSDIIGSHISAFMQGTPALKVLETGEGYTESEEIYKSYRGTFHFIVTAKPYFRDGETDGVVISFRDIVEAQKLAYNIHTRDLKYTFDDIIGSSEALMKIKSQAAIIARGNSTVLITGESGTGKEMFAKAIHYSGSRAAAPFVTVNCAAIPENLLESELFGYEKGAFTGAGDKGKAGKFEIADGGTVFLDEIGDMPLHLQVKILHVLQDKRFERVGGNRTIIANVRVIAATNRNPEEMIREGSFREDLYYRLSVIPLYTPPLRERKEDIVPLMDFFLKKYNAFMNRNLTGFSDEARKVYEDYAWPGNVRELENAVEYGVNMAQGIMIDVDAIPRRLFDTADIDALIEEDSLSIGERVRRFENAIITSKLRKYGNTSDAKDEVAKELGISRATLYRKLAEMDI